MGYLARITCDADTKKLGTENFCYLDTDASTSTVIPSTKGDHAITRAENEANNSGWTYTHDEKWICPACMFAYLEKCGVKSPTADFPKKSV